VHGFAVVFAAIGEAFYLGARCGGEWLAHARRIGRRLERDKSQSGWADARLAKFGTDANRGGWIDFTRTLRGLARVKRSKWKTQRYFLRRERVPTLRIELGDGGFAIGLAGRFRDGIFLSWIFSFGDVAEDSDFL